MDRRERVMVDRLSNSWLSSHLTPGQSARVCYLPGTNVNTPICVRVVPEYKEDTFYPGAKVDTGSLTVHTLCQFQGSTLAFHTHILLLLVLKMILTIKLCEMEQICTQDTQGVYSAPFCAGAQACGQAPTVNIAHEFLQTR